MRFVDEDGTLWREVQLDRSLVEGAMPFAAAAGRTIEQYIADCLEMAAESRPTTVPVVTLASGESESPAAARLNVTLDEEASRLVRQVQATDPDYTLADVVNGAMRFDYGMEGAEAVASDECLEAARIARLAREQKEEA